MSERVLLQVWVDHDTAGRVEAIKRAYRLDNAELLRAALARELERLETHPQPFADTPAL